MSTPPVPPRPYYKQPAHQRRVSNPPPIPPLPSNFRPDPEYWNDPSPPHFADPLVAPRPHKYMPSVPADMANQLENQASPPLQQQPWARPLPQPSNPSGLYAPPNQPWLTQSPPSGQQGSWAGGFRPSPSPRPLPSPVPPPQNVQRNSWTPPSSSWGVATPPAPTPMPYPVAPEHGTHGPPVNSTYFVDPSASGISQAFEDISPLVNPFAAGQQAPAPAHSSPSLPNLQPIPFAAMPPNPGPNDPPNLVIPLPTVGTLNAALPTINAQADPARAISWSKQVLSLVDRTQQIAPNHSSSSSSAIISDPDLIRLTRAAIPHIRSISSIEVPPGASSTFTLAVAEALYLRASLQSTGSFPTEFSKDPRAAFRDYESAARKGYSAAWFKLGRDYEAVGDQPRAKDCFERGVKLGEKSCLYRLGMANLMGQLGHPRDPTRAVPLLKQAADLSDVDVPQPSYVYGMLLLGEFNHVDIPSALFLPYLSTGGATLRTEEERDEARHAEARKYIERGSYLNFAPAQYKSGWSYEYAKMGCAFDPLLSVSYYTLASEQGEVEADMALSKWFLCGAEGAFDKDEGLAYTFAERAAKKGLPSAEFAMGYYLEVGVGGRKDLNEARRWYELAKAHNNPDAGPRLEALSQPSPQSLSRAEHDALTDNKLVRKRTAAAEYSRLQGRKPTLTLPPVAEGGGAPADGGMGKVVLQKANRQARRPATEGPPPTSWGGGGPPGGYPVGGNVPGPALGRGAPPPQQPQPQLQQPPPQPQPQPQRNSSPRRRQSPPQHSSSSMPPSQVGRGARGGAPPQQRYSLIDGPVKSQQQPPAAQSPPPQQEPPRKGPATFEEMGFSGKRAEDKDCIIM